MRRWPLLTSGKRLEDVKEVFGRIVGYSGISHGDGYHNSRGSPWHASSAAGGWRRLPDHWNVAGSPALSASGTPRTSQLRRVHYDSRIGDCRHYFFVNVVRCVITHRHFPSRLTKTSVALSRVLNSRSMYFALLEVSAVTMAVVP